MSDRFKGQNPDDFMRKSMATYMDLLNMQTVARGDGWAEMALPWRKELVGDSGTGFVASGAIFSMMDSAAGMALYSALPDFEPLATLDLRIDYLRPAAIGATIFGRAEVVKLTRRVAFIRGIAHDGDANRPVANVTGTFMRTSQS